MIPEDLAYTPINLPYVKANNEDEFLQYFDERKDIVVSSNYGITPWHGICIFSASGVVPEKYDRSPAAFDFPEKFPEIWRGCLNLPFKEITLAHMWEQYKSVPTHHDPFNPGHMVSYRIKFIDKSTVPSFYFCGYNLEKKYLNLPEDTNTFAFSNKQIMHGADMPNNRKIMLWCYGIIDQEKHEKLIENSIEKYKGRQIYGNPFNLREE